MSEWGKKVLARRSQADRIFSLSQQYVLWMLVLSVLGLLSLRFALFPSSPPAQTRNPETVVEVVGAVRISGIHLFDHLPTLREVIERAGGLEDAVLSERDSSSLSLETGTSVAVVKEHPGETRITIGRMEAKKLLVFSVPLDLNRATQEDLCLIPGVGESLAGEITAYRERRRGFRSADELSEVRGIGDKKYRSLRPFLTVR